MSLSQRKTREEEDIAKTILLVPELCNLTGLTDQMRADFKVMKDVAQFTRVTPTQRQEVSSWSAWSTLIFPGYSLVYERRKISVYVLGSFQMFEAFAIFSIH